MLEEHADDDATGKGDGSGGVAARIFYTCETATEDQRTGAWWTYRTGAFNNTLDATNVWVIKEHADGRREDYGAVTVRKSTTDTWSTNGLTLRLVQKGAGKSVRVDHSSVGLVASEKNGWCSSIEVPDATSYRPHDWFYGGQGALARAWELVEIDWEPIGDVPKTPIFDMHTPHESDPNKKHQGTIDFLSLCDPIAEAGGGPATVPANAGDWITLLFRVFTLGRATTAAAQCIANDGLVQATKRWVTSREPRDLPAVPTSFYDDCADPTGSGSQPLYASLEEFNGWAISQSCIHLYVPTSGSAKPYIHMRTISHEDFEVSPWTTMVAR